MSQSVCVGVHEIFNFQLQINMVIREKQNERVSSKSLPKFVELIFSNTRNYQGLSNIIIFLEKITVSSDRYMERQFRSFIYFYVAKLLFS